MRVYWIFINIINYGILFAFYLLFLLCGHDIVILRFLKIWWLNCCCYSSYIIWVTLLSYVWTLIIRNKILFFLHIILTLIRCWIVKEINYFLFFSNKIINYESFLFTNWFLIYEFSVLQGLKIHISNVSTFQKISYVIITFSIKRFLFSFYVSNLEINAFAFIIQIFSFILVIHSCIWIPKIWLMRNSSLRYSILILILIHWLLLLLLLRLLFFTFLLFPLSGPFINIILWTH
jgi:hypothetical protein